MRTQKTQESENTGGRGTGGPDLGMAPASGDVWGRASKPSGLVGVCAMCLVLFAISQLPLRLSFSSDRQAQVYSSVDSSLFQGFISNPCGRPFVNSVKCRSGGDQGTAIVFLAAYTKFPPGTPLGDLFYLKAVLVARISNPTAPIIFLLPKEVITRHPEMLTLLGTYRINIRWIDDLEQAPLFKTFDQKHKAYCARLNITTCFWDLMYTRFGMAAQILRAEGYQRALFLDNDVGLYEDISFFTRFPEGWVSAFDWTTQVALWDVETMENFFNWMMHYFDTEPAPVTEDPGDMMGARLFLRRHPQRSRRILCGPGESLLCGNGPVFQAMESIQHVNCDLVNQTSCPLHNCGNQFEKMIIWKQDNRDRYIPFLNGTIQLPVIHFGDACEPAINTKMYPVTLTGLKPATSAPY